LEIKDVLYEAISRYGEKRLFSDIVQGDSQDAINSIMNDCHQNIEKINIPESERYGSLAEALLHYLLTVALIPSQRKTSHKSVGIDIVIPDIRTLELSPQDALVISFPKTGDNEAIKSSVNEIKKIQSNPKNIWVILEKNVPIDAKVYTLRDGMTFANIINDLITFSSDKKQSKLKIFKI